jgi:hypothetical protein
MARAAVRRRPGAISIVLIVASIGGSAAVALAMDAVVLRFSTAAPFDVLLGVLPFNATCIAQSIVGSCIEWRRPGHTIGRLLMLSGPLFAFLAAGWQTAAILEPFVNPRVYQLVSWGGLLLNYPGVALIAGWVPLLFPTGTLPSPRWRIPVGVLVVLSGIGLTAWAIRPGPMTNGSDLISPIALAGWPDFLQPFIYAIPLELLALFVLAVAALVSRYRRGDRVERLQIRWFASSVAFCAVGFAGVVVEMAVRPDGGAQVATFVVQTGLLAMPIAIGVAVTRYRLYEIDRLISRTIGWALVTGILVVVIGATVLGLQAALAGVTQGQTLTVAASTLLAFALFQPVRRRVQTRVDRRFDRARYDGDRTVAAFSERLRDQVDLAGVEGDIATTILSTLHPTSMRVWIRGTVRSAPKAEVS